MRRTSALEPTPSHDLRGGRQGPRKQAKTPCCQCTNKARLCRTQHATRAGQTDASTQPNSHLLCCPRKVGGCKQPAAPRLSGFCSSTTGTHVGERTLLGGPTHRANGHSSLLQLFLQTRIECPGFGCDERRATATQRRCGRGRGEREVTHRVNTGPASTQGIA